MKREFLQNLKVGDQALPKEIIDAILDENSRDIGEAKKPFADYKTVKEQLEQAQATIRSIQAQGTDLETAQQAAREWETKYNTALAQHQAELAKMAFDHSLEQAITAAKGRSVKAITALLDVDALRESKNQESDIKAALEGLKKESGYLFDTEKAPPPYSPGAGTGMNPGANPMDALRIAAGLKPNGAN